MANTSLFVLAILVFTGTLILNGFQVSAECGISLPNLIFQCQRYVTGPGPKVPPSEGCCAVVKKIDIPCACKLLNPGIEKLINIEKLVYVGRTCGLTIAAGTKCGSYTVPPGLRK